MRELASETEAIWKLFQILIISSSRAALELKEAGTE